VILRDNFQHIGQNELELYFQLKKCLEDSIKELSREDKIFDKVILRDNFQDKGQNEFQIKFHIKIMFARRYSRI
jgi:hypothetical protein